ncbi:MAG: insulinase family protein, partial [Lentisphaeria bacterium]|nr:insulinase family protein [Lentisphaeria bacterium]
MTRNNTPSIAEKTISAELSNGLKIYVYPRPGSGTVFTQAVVRTGSIHEGEFLGCGLSHFLEHMVFSGTETHPGHLDIA